MSSACSQALGLPEIVAAIMEQLPCKSSLFAALQVNRLWADEATRVLWRADPPIQGLMQIGSVERRQYYANKISSLDMFLDSERDWSQLVNTRFPRLIEIDAQIFNERNQQHLYHFLQPTLRSFGLYGSQSQLELLLQLATRCPDLSVLEVGWPKCPLLSRDLVRSLDLMPSLTHISLSYRADAKLYLHLASRPNLQVLRMVDVTLTEDEAIRILATVTNPYSELRCLTWFAQDKAFRCLARHLSSLNVLKLTLVDTSDDILCAISDCTNLTKIVVWFRDGGSYVPAEGLLAVARKCSHLRVFALLSNFNVDGRSITDEIIGQVGTYLPKMTCFRLGIHTNLTVAALLYLGDRCTKLRECELIGDFDLEQLCRPNSAPLFPQLQRLELRRVSENVLYDRAVSILLQEYPQLRLCARLPSEMLSSEIENRSIYIRHPGYFGEVQVHWGRADRLTRRKDNTLFASSGSHSMTWLWSTPPRLPQRS